MLDFKKIILIVLISVSLIGCSTKTPLSTPGITVVVKTSTPSGPAYPQPAQTVPTVTMNLTYPGPEGNQTVPQTITTPEYFVKNLTIPTPSSGKAVVTGQLLIGGKGGTPYMATLYLGPTLAPSTPDYPPLISFSESSDPLAVQDVDTGTFLFTNVDPGQYGIIVWSPLGGNPLNDADGNTIMFTVKANEVKDLGIIALK